MTRNGFVRSLVGLALLALAACEPSLPQPFQPETIPRLTKPGVRAGLVVAPVAGAPDGAAFARAVAEALVDSDFAATTQPIIGPSYRLLGRAVPDGNSVRLEWHVENAAGKLVGGAAFGLSPDLLPGWRAGNPAAYSLLARKTASQIGDVLSETRAGPLEAPVILVPDVAGAPGDGPRTMQRSMAYVLDKRGLKVAESPNGDPAPTLVLQGAMKVETRNARSHVEIVWTLKRPDGTELGTVAQANDLPAEMLQRPWGDIAFSIADAAADGIADLVAKTTTPPPAADDSP